MDQMKKLTEDCEQDYQMNAPFLELDGDTYEKRMEYAFSLLSDVQEMISQGQNAWANRFCNYAKIHIHKAQMMQAPKCQKCGEPIENHPSLRAKGLCNDCEFEERTGQKKARN